MGLGEMHKRNVALIGKQNMTLIGMVALALLHVEWIGKDTVMLNMVVLNTVLLGMLKDDTVLAELAALDLDKDEAVLSKELVALDVDVLEVVLLKCNRMADARSDGLNS